MTRRAATAEGTTAFKSRSRFSGSAQNQQSYFSAAHVLLIWNASIDRYEDIECSGLGSFEQVSVFQSGQIGIAGGLAIVARK